MSVLQNVPVEPKTSLERWKRVSRRSIRRTVTVATSVGGAFLRFLGCLFAAEIRLGKWLVTPDYCAAAGQRVFPEPSAWTTATFRMQDTDCPASGTDVWPERKSRRLTYRGGFSGCVLFPRCKLGDAATARNSFDFLQSRTNSSPRNRRANGFGGHSL